MQPLTIVGAPGSPYSRKLLAILRFRRIPYRWVTVGSPEAAELPKPRVELLPQLILDDDNGVTQANTDTTPLIRRLEQTHSGRSVIPEDPVVRFIDALIEDYADEWLTKAMFHYRWAFPADIANAQSILPRWFRTNAPEAQSVAAGQQFGARQIDRRGVVGSNDATASVIESSYLRLLLLLDERLTTSRFVLGDRPGTCDFALYGQLTQLARFDPTSMNIALENAPRVCAWVDLVEDLSGVTWDEPGWISREELADATSGLLTEIGRVYTPFLLANAEALEKGAAEVRTVIDGVEWVQGPFPYQAKCLRWIRESYAALSASDQAAINQLTAGSGCEALFTDA
jgi:glutathione S-transferase